MDIKKIHHVAIICSNYQKSKQFYVDILGFKIIRETWRQDRKSYKLDLSVGKNDQIELFSFPSPPKRQTQPEAQGLRHIALEVEDIYKSTAYLKARGVSVENIRIDNLTGKLFTFFLDPDQLPIEIYQA